MHARAFVALSGTVSWFVQRTPSVKLQMSPPTMNDMSFETAKKLAQDMGSPRMRFAPSPTGSLHVGGARTALYFGQRHYHSLRRASSTDCAGTTG